MTIWSIVIAEHDKRRSRAHAEYRSLPRKAAVKFTSWSPVKMRRLQRRRPRRSPASPRCCSPTRPTRRRPRGKRRRDGAAHRAGNYSHILAPATAYGKNIAAAHRSASSTSRRSRKSRRSIPRIPSSARSTRATRSRPCSRAIHQGHHRAHDGLRCRCRRRAAARR